MELSHTLRALQLAGGGTLTAAFVAGAGAGDKVQSAFHRKCSGNPSVQARAADIDGGGALKSDFVAGAG